MIFVAQIHKICQIRVFLCYADSMLYNTGFPCADCAYLLDCWRCQFSCCFMKSARRCVLTCLPDAAAVARKAGEPLVIEEITVAPPKARELRVRVLCSALCFSDIHFWRLKVWISSPLITTQISITLHMNLYSAHILTYFLVLFEGTSWVLSKNFWSWNCWVSVFIHAKY